jgi:hypothetical protein
MPDFVPGSYDPDAGTHSLEPNGPGISSSLLVGIAGSDRDPCILSMQCSQGSSPCSSRPLPSSDWSLVVCLARHLDIPGDIIKTLGSGSGTTTHNFRATRIPLPLRGASKYSITADLQFEGMEPPSVFRPWPSGLPHAGYRWLGLGPGSRNARLSPHSAARAL